MSRLLVLCWHNVDPTDAFHGPSAEAGRAGLHRQLRWVQRWLTAVPLRPALDALAAGRKLPPRAVALTFDDGYRDNATVAAPMLAAMGLPATFFLVPGFLSGEVDAWWERLAWLFAHATVDQVDWAGGRHVLTTPGQRRAAATTIAEQVKGVDRNERAALIDELRGRLTPDGPPAGRVFMNWEEARGLARHGVDAQSHTCTHPILSRENTLSQSDELIRSRRELEQSLGHTVDVLAYPNGSRRDYDQETLRLTAEAGYAFALTTRPAWGTPHDPRLEIPRLVLDPAIEDLRLLKRTVQAALAPIPSIRGTRGSLPS